jgi:hypothetical protein
MESQLGLALPSVYMALAVQIGMYPSVHRSQKLERVEKIQLVEVPA